MVKTVGGVDGVGSSLDGVTAATVGTATAMEEMVESDQQRPQFALHLYIKTSANLVIPLICAIAISLRIRESKINTGV